MRVLAIDTACAAAVLDTDHGVVASETLPMVRGHAESLIPLTAP
jgi:tRNA threonylcarbamoyladenosine biosynthesis protein TsaB